ncbi:MAG: putative sensor protein [Clostridia bacterium]|nr:putative sensor protein [Clostridia bacterium]
MKTDQNRIHNLTEYVQGIMNNENGKELYLKYKVDLEQVTPQEVFEIFHSLLQKGSKPTEILVILDKVINVFYKSLIGYSWKRPEKNSFVDYLLQENRALISKLDTIKEIIKEKDFQVRKKELLPKIRELQHFNQHYLKKENILFPYLEKKMKKFDGLAIMWALHDETRTRLKKVIESLENEDCIEEEFNIELGNLFFAMHGLIKKEELILYPAASEIIDQNEWIEMQKQSLEYEFPFIKKPEQEMEEKDIAAGINEFIADFKEGYQFKTETGILGFEQILMIFNALPVDMTFVDENNKVKFFTRPKDRIFPRSPAIIGRDVDKCHPPQSVHVVHEIIEAFRNGKKDNATFWINIKGKMILIQYFALRDSMGVYKGVLEVSQDITEIRALEGEKRLLHWEK